MFRGVMICHVFPSLGGADTATDALRWTCHTHQHAWTCVAAHTDIMLHVTHGRTCKVLLASGNRATTEQKSLLPDTAWTHTHCVTGCYTKSHTTPYGSILQWTRRVRTKCHAIHVVHIRIVLVLIERASARIHEEVRNRRNFQPQLFCNRCLHLLAWTFRLLEYRQQGAPLYVGEHKTWFLWCRQLRFGEIFFPFACCKRRPES